MTSGLATGLVPSPEMLAAPVSTLIGGWHRAADHVRDWTGRLRIALRVQQAAQATWLQDAVQAQGDISDGISIASRPRRWAATVHARIRQKATR